MRAHLEDNLPLTHHAKIRMGGRGFASQSIDLVLGYGREIRSRGAVFHVIGKKEIEHFRKLEPRLKDLEGIQVVTSEDGMIITVYRNRDLRQIRPVHRKQRHYH